LIAEAKEKHMSPTQGRGSAKETQPGTVTEQTCANCGMKQDEWRTPKGYLMDSETFCCEGCATGTGCTC
jgi:hypothetical protein